MKSIILASTSPRRVEYMNWLGIPFQAVSPSLDEKNIHHDSPEQLAKLLAKAKAGSLKEYHPNSIIIGADTVVNFQGQALGKPRDEQHQREMINLQKGKVAEAYSPICILDTTSNQETILSIATRYTVASPASEQVERYIESKSGLDKAGGFGVQDNSGLFLGDINGCYTNIVAMPLCELKDALEKIGVAIAVDIKERVRLKTGRGC